MYVYNTLLTVFTLGLPKAYAYYLPKYSVDFSKDIINKVTRLFFILGAAFSLTLLLFAGTIASILNNPDLKTALILFSPTPFFLLPTMGMDTIYASFRRTKQLAFYTIATRILTIICTILPVILFSGSYIHAIIGFDVASLLTFILALYLINLPVKGVEHKKSPLTYKSVLKFALPLLYASLWGLIIASADQFFISRYYGNEAFADYSNGFMELPFVGMVIGSVSSVLLPVFSGMDRGTGMNNEIIEVWNNALIKSAKLIFPMLIYGAFFAVPIMTCMYGDLYRQSAVYFVIKNLSGLFFIIPFHPIILAIGKTSEYAKVHMFMAFVVVLVELLVCKTLDSAVFIALASVLCQVLKIWLLMRIIAAYAQKNIFYLVPPKPLLILAGISAIAALPPFILMYFVEVNKFVLLCSSLFLFILFYYIFCWIGKISYKDVLGGFIQNSSKLNRIMKFLP